MKFALISIFLVQKYSLLIRIKYDLVDVNQYVLAILISYKYNLKQLFIH